MAQEFDEQRANARHKEYLQEIRGIRDVLDKIILAHRSRRPESPQHEDEIYDKMRKSMRDVIKDINDFLDSLP